MEPVFIEDIVRWSKGRLLCGDPQTKVDSVCINSREVQRGTLFVPIIGEKVDAHQFIPSALKSGAAAVLTQEHEEAQGEGTWIRVEDTVRALQEIAAGYRSRFSIPVVGITGSVGKTSTKEMVAAALSAGKKVMKTAGNFNSQIGLPLTMFGLEQGQDVAVIEMGMSDFGEMSRLSAIARPACAVMTNIGISHIEQLKTQQNIRSEKLHIIDCFPQDGVLYLNVDDPMLEELMGNLPVRTIGYGIDNPCDYRAENICCDGENTRFHLTCPEGEAEIQIPAIGEHHVRNALAAIAVAKGMGLSLSAIQQGLSHYQNAAMRQQIHRLPSLTVIDDSYNASPDSAKSGLSVLVQLQNKGRNVAVLADMLELGEYSVQAHRQLGETAARMGVDLLVSVGERARAIADGAASEGIPVQKCQTNQEAIDYLKGHLQTGDAVLVKGSRGMHTDEIVKALLTLDDTFFCKN